ncbi:hypothetical protein RJ640_011896 [Escallonia rubra]|uniref:Disease resistance protein RPM1-like n=1 Tax=Escallonia rubra TaxID=112253 RepID=A0AA88ULX9_9ASTE|nr:hypothetical protein RJ640_011896 [Escallonia rubra]
MCARTSVSGVGRTNMADGAVNFALDKLTTILLQKSSLLGDSHDEIEEIKLELESMRSFLVDAEKSKKSSELETWIMQVRNVSHQVEDVIDEFLHDRDTQQDRKGFKNFVQGVVNLPNQITARYKISSKLQRIKAKVHEVSERSKRYAFHAEGEPGSNKTAPNDWWQHHGGGELSAFADEDEIVGMDENKKTLMRWLTGQDRRRTVISIVGMGGLGKTTLVAEVYHDPEIKHLFGCWAWISVSQAKGVEELLISMVKEFLKANQVTVPINLASMNYRQLGEMLIEYLHNKRYVIVLDDVWSIDLWTRIRSAFPNNNLGSRVIFTTRNENAATIVGPGIRVHRLEPLRESDAWTLFCKKAFWRHPDGSCPVELEALARGIVRKCEGLPLALVTIGRLMCSRNQTAVEWKKVYDSLTWSNNPMLERVNGILSLSFKDLEFELKHCFLYCCAFPEGYQIKRKKLIRLWVAEGFIIERKGMTMEERAEEYLTELNIRSMIQVTETNDAERAKTLRVHDVMRELAVTTSDKENFCTVYDGRESRLEGKIQRLSIYNRGKVVHLSKATSHSLRTLFVFETDIQSPFSLNALSSSFKFLRVIDLEGVSIEKVSGTLVGLFNLRYLNLRETKIRKLPKSMERLRNLQTLDVRNTNVEKLPSGITDMPRLRHLLCGSKDLNTKTSSFPRGMQVPARLGNIRCLQTLACIEAEEELIQQIGYLTELKRLGITRLRAVDGANLCASVQKMTSLHYLSLIAITEHEELQLEALYSPPLYIQKLTLVGKLKQLPHWIESRVNLTHLYLAFSGLDENILSSLNSLPTLVVLELKKAYQGKLLHFKTGEFGKLKKLRLLDLASLDEVTIEEGSLSSIRDLYLIRCEELKVLPEGIEHLTSLQKLHLEEMPEEFVQGLRSNTSNVLAKVRHIPTIIHVCLTEQGRAVESFSSQR